MLRFDHAIKPSRIPGAGLGLFTVDPQPRGRVLIMPNEAQSIRSAAELAMLSRDSIEHASSVRWFEQVHTVDPAWSEESHLNHSFEPNCLWHLGFVFALRDLAAGEELTIDYRHLLDEATLLDFRDSITGREIRGFAWRESIARSSRLLVELFEADAMVLGRGR
ncbi:MAG: SET domain-containing protein [Phycisphaerae bacterium]|nr:SET domain-containing protein [Phycisphaerae bacterium]